MKNRCNIKVCYKELPDSVVLKSNIFKIKNYESLKNEIIKEANDKERKDEFGNNSIKENEKFVLEFEKKLSGLENIYNEDTFAILKKKAIENEIRSLKAFIIKVEEYPEFKQPQIYKTFETAMKKAINEFTESIQKELTEEDLENGNRLYIKQKKEEREFNDELYKNIHANIFCNNCRDGNFFGLRYVCAECSNFNFCENCYKNDTYSHNKEHTFIRIKDPINLAINNYSCIFNPRKIMVYKPYNSFELNVEIINNGIENLSLCFISPIRFGKKYLGCSKTSVTDSISNGQKFKIKMLVTFEDEPVNGEEFQPMNEYEGYFRLITKYGIPFGDILYLKVIIEN